MDPIILAQYTQPPPPIETGDPLANGILSAILYLVPLLLGWLGGRRSGRTRTVRELELWAAAPPTTPPRRIEP